jgi:endonuclease G
MNKYSTKGIQMRLLQQNRLALFLVVLGLNMTSLVASATVETVLGSVPLASNDNLAGIMPTTSQSEIILSRPQYVISYNKNRRAPNWVAWKLEANQLGSQGRSNKFAQDTELESYLSPSGFHAVQPTEYKGFCFDRGHQIPSGDRTDSLENNEATFLMSNMIPQTAYLNRVIWEHLEDHTRELVQKEGKKVYVIAGPIYDQDFGVIGPNGDIPVPSKDFKIVIVLDANQTPADITTETQVIAVVMPNVQKDGTVASRSSCDEPTIESNTPMASSSENVNDWEQYQTTVGQIESMAGIKLVAVQPNHRKRH